MKGDRQRQEQTYTVFSCEKTKADRYFLKRKTETDGKKYVHKETDRYKRRPISYEKRQIEPEKYCITDSRALHSMTDTEYMNRKDWDKKTETSRDRSKIFKNR